MGSWSFSPAALLGVAIVAVLIWGVAETCRRYRWARLPSVLVPIAVGTLFGYGALSAPSGYAAAYSFGGVWALSLATVLGAAVLLPLPRTRRAGLLGLGAALLLLGSFYAVFLVGRGLGLQDWWGDRPVPIPPVEPK